MDCGKLIKPAQETPFSGDFAGAEELYLKAAEAGSGHAAHIIGVLYLSGGPGIEADFGESPVLPGKVAGFGFKVFHFTSP